MNKQILLILDFLGKNHATIISVISLLLSLYNWWYNFIHTKAKINLIYKEHKLLATDGTPLCFNLIIENLSHLDVSISRMFLKVGKEIYEFDFLPYHVIKMNAPEETKIIYSSSLPITISGLGAFGGFLCIRTNKYQNFNIESLYTQKVSIIVHTNRKLKKSFIITPKKELSSMH